MSGINKHALQRLHFFKLTFPVTVHVYSPLSFAVRLSKIREFCMSTESEPMVLKLHMMVTLEPFQTCSNITSCLWIWLPRWISRERVSECVCMCLCPCAYRGAQGRKWPLGVTHSFPLSASQQYSAHQMARLATNCSQMCLNEWEMTPWSLWMFNHFNTPKT